MKRVLLLGMVIGAPMWAMDRITSLDSADGTDDAYSSGNGHHFTRRELKELKSFVKYVRENGVDNWHGYVADDPYVKRSSSELVHGENLLDIFPDALAQFAVVRNQIEMNIRESLGENEFYSMLKAVLEFTKENNPHAYQRYTQQVANKLFSKHEYQEEVIQSILKLGKKKAGKRPFTRLARVLDLPSHASSEVDSETVGYSDGQTNQTVESVFEGELPEKFSALLAQVSDVVVNHILQDKESLLQASFEELQHSESRLTQSKQKANGYKKTIKISTITNVGQLIITLISLLLAFFPASEDGCVCNVTST